MALLPAAAWAQGAVHRGMSPIVTWDAESVYGGVARLPTRRALSGAETRLARQRAEQVFEALKRAPAFSRPAGVATYLTSWAVVNEQKRVEQQFIAFASNPRDVRRRADGALWGVMGGVHELLFMYTNRLPGADKLAPREHQTFHRQVNNDALGAFAAPQVVAEVGGGQLYGGYLILTRDGRPALAPAATGALLEEDVAVHKRRIADQESGFARSLRELEAAMTPEAIAARRARREAIWGRETRDAAALAARLDAAERTDDVTLFIAWLGEDHCGHAWQGAPTKAKSLGCEHKLPLLRQLDWSAPRRALRW